MIFQLLINFVKALHHFLVSSKYSTFSHEISIYSIYFSSVCVLCDLKYSSRLYSLFGVWIINLIRNSTYWYTNSSTCSYTIRDYIRTFYFFYHNAVYTSVLYIPCNNVFHYVLYIPCNIVFHYSVISSLIFND